MPEPELLPWSHVCQSDQLAEAKALLELLTNLPGWGDGLAVGEYGCVFCPGPEMVWSMDLNKHHPDCAWRRTRLWLDQHR